MNNNKIWGIVHHRLYLGFGDYHTDITYIPISESVKQILIGKGIKEYEHSDDIYAESMNMSTDDYIKSLYYEVDQAYPSYEQDDPVKLVDDISDLIF